MAEKLVDYANTTNVEFIVDPKVLFHVWLIYSYLHLSWSSDCVDWFFDNIMTWSYCFHRRNSMSQQKNSILLNERALNRELVPLKVVFVLYYRAFLLTWPAPMQIY